MDKKFSTLHIIITNLDSSQCFSLKTSFFYVSYFLNNFTFSQSKMGGKI